MSVCKAHTVIIFNPRFLCSMFGGKRDINLEASKLEGAACRWRRNQRAEASLHCRFSPFAQSLAVFTPNLRLCPVAAAELCGPLALVAALDLV